jgi:NADH-quinone oxidoreductase subunit D
MAMELGAFTPFLWFVKAREMVWDILEEETGARLTHSFGRIGGMAFPPTAGFKGLVRAALPKILATVEEGEKMLLKNRIFLDRLEGVGGISAADAIALSWSGPCLRASGVPYDVRKAHPYLKYDEVDFDVPVGKSGDNLDRFLVRLMELRQSAKILLQCADRMADSGPVNADDPRFVLPEKKLVYTTIEATIQHFKLIMEGAKIPAGEVYSYTEGGNGELGFYLVSDGSGTPYRVRIRPPCYPITGGLSKLIEGNMLSDIVPTFGSLNMIGGECDH